MDISPIKITASPNALSVISVLFPQLRIIIWTHIKKSVELIKRKKISSARYAGKYFHRQICFLKVNTLSITKLNIMIFHQSLKIRSNIFAQNVQKSISVRISSMLMFGKNIQ